MSIWGAKVTNLKPLAVSGDEEKQLTITQAVLVSGTEKTVLEVTIGGENYVVSNFKPVDRDRVSLDLVLNAGDETTYYFNVKGDGEVHLMGYHHVPLVGNPMFMDVDDSDSDSEDTPGKGKRDWAKAMGDEDDVFGKKAAEPQGKKNAPEPKKSPQTKANSKTGIKDNKTPDKEVKTQLVGIIKDTQGSQKTKKGIPTPEKEVKLTKKESPAKIIETPKEGIVVNAKNEKETKGKKRVKTPEKEGKKEGKAKGKKRQAADTTKQPAKKQKTSTEPQVKCNDCGKAFATESGLNQHVLAKHKKPEEAK